MNWSQLKTVLWLRWRLTRNQFWRKGKVNGIVALIGLIFGICLAVGAGVGGLLAGATALQHAPAEVMMLVWDAIAGAFLFFWAIGVLTELQRSESIDLSKLLHLPVSLEGIFVINYVASHLTPSIIIFIPGTVGLCLGLAWSRGWMMLLLLPLACMFIFMVTAWTYCIRGWLLAMMVNPRKRRNVMVFLTLFIVLVGQGPNLYFNVYLRHSGYYQRIGSGHKSDHKIPPGWVSAHNYVPFLWLPKGAMSLVNDNPVPAVLGSCGAFLLGAAGLARAYKSTLRFYTGTEKGKTKTISQPAVTGGVPGTIPKNFMERRVPFVAEEVAALALAFYRSMSRAPEIKIAMFTNLVVIVVMFGIVFSNSLQAKSAMFHLFSATGIVTFTFFGLIQVLFNQFGFDRDGFRLLVLSPASRQSVLLAKNLSMAPFVFGLGLIGLAVISVVMTLNPLVTLSGVFQLVTMFLALSIAGNFVSTWAPYRVTAGSLKPTKPPPKMILLVLVTQLLFPVAMIPIILPPLIGWGLANFGFWPAPVVDLILSAVFLALAVIFYKLSLKGLGDFLESREQKILLVVSQEVE